MYTRTGINIVRFVTRSHKILCQERPLATFDCSGLFFELFVVYSSLVQRLLKNNEVTP